MNELCSQSVFLGLALFVMILGGRRPLVNDSVVLDRRKFRGQDPLDLLQVVRATT